MGEKSMCQTTSVPKGRNALLSIQEFSEISGVKPSTLRYWDELGLFSPAQRNEKTGYRFYSPEQLAAVDVFKLCRELNTPLKNMRGISDPAEFFRLCNEQIKTIETKILELRASQDLLKRYVALTEESKAAESERRVAQARFLGGKRNVCETAGRSGIASRKPAPANT
jgi:DNA-binding transcriptional MerR regulator